MTTRSAVKMAFFMLAVGFFISATGRAVEAGTVSASGRGGEQKVLGDLDIRTPTGEQISLIPLISRRAIVIGFWAAWCPICREAVPRLNGLNSNPLVKVIAVNEGDSNKIIKAYMAKHGIEYQVAVDPDGAVAKAFGVPGMPFCVILGRSGLIVYRGSGLPEDIDYYVAQ